ncbi:MAG: oxygen-independent coproporphyrinogen III oxidase [Planctomycetes bacterium]|nr:oxygen-independent coproporphyrinogen III oxidase [Planctomycetota bacterium]
MPTVTGEVDLEVFRRYAGISLPRHVSYPMPNWWKEMGGAEAASMISGDAVCRGEHDLSLYLHIPFCEALCRFCACNKVIQKHSTEGATQRTARYVAALRDDIRRVANLVEPRRPLRQIHYGGGSPLYLSDDQLASIHETLADCFDIATDAEVSIEIDPRNATPGRAQSLWRIGFNRISMGVQDFNADVQAHVRRIQPFEQVRDVVSACRDAGFASINFDLIYGLPYQTPGTIRHTIEQAIELGPDRVAYYHYAQIPDKIATQRGIDHTKLPDSETKLEMFLVGHAVFEAAGYQFIGLDHFARPDEGLAAALNDGTIQRSFQGMTTGGGLHLLGAGVSAISYLMGVGFLQNVKDTDGFTARVEAGESPNERGIAFSFDDCVRQAVIHQLYCEARIRPETLESRFDIVFADYFARELAIMSELAADGLVTIDAGGEIDVAFPLGRVLMRNVAAVFDAYLDPQSYRFGEKVCFSTNA